MTQPLMPKATAMWLIDNSALTFEQIGEYCGMHILEVQSMADGEVNIGIIGFDPISHGQLTKEEIDRCAADPSARLEMAESTVPVPTTRAKGPRYTPVARHQDRPDGIAWLLRNMPELTDGQISRLVGTTKPTINAIRERTHWNMANIKPRDPVSLSLCGREELKTAIEKAQRSAERASKRKAKEEAKAKAAQAAKAAAAPAAEVADTGAIITEPFATPATPEPAPKPTPEPEVESAGTDPFAPPASEDTAPPAARDNGEMDQGDN